MAPFLFFNGNTFAEVARRTTDALLAEFPLARRREASSLAAHHVAGVLDHESLVLGLASLTEPCVFRSSAPESVCQTTRPALPEALIKETKT